MFCIEYKIIFCFPCEQVTSSQFTCVGGIVSKVKERSPNFQISFLFFLLALALNTTTQTIVALVSFSLH
jgi:hypothetical protein